MIDIRYLGLTLIGVFLALAIGLMAGSALGSPDKQAAAFEGLRREFELLRDENTRVREEAERARRRLDARDTALRNVLPRYTRDRLAGVGVGVVICGAVDERPFWGELEGSLRRAGAVLTCVVRIPDELTPLSTTDRARLGGAWSDGAMADEPERYEVVTWLARGLVRGGVSERLEELSRLTGVELRGDWRPPVRRLLVISGAPTEERYRRLLAGDAPELRLVDAARREGARVVAAEPETVAFSAMEALAARGATTVDDVDAPLGQLSVVLALAGADGRFGNRPGAGRPTPPLEER